MSVTKWHDINRWIVRVPLTMASTAADGPSGGLSVVALVANEVTEPDAPSTDTVVYNAAEPEELASAVVESADGADGGVAPVTIPTTGTQSKGKGKSKASADDEGQSKGKGKSKSTADDEGTGDAVGKKPVKGKPKASTKSAAKKRPAACASGGSVKLAKRPAACVEDDASQATQSVEPPPVTGVVAPGTNTPGPAPAPAVATSTAIVPHGAVKATQGDPKYRDKMKSRRFQQLWDQKALPAECMQLIDEATAAKARGDILYYQPGSFP